MVKEMTVTAPFGFDNYRYGTYITFNKNIVSWYGITAEWNINYNNIIYFYVAGL